MRHIIYIYLKDKMADWELGYILQGLSMQSMLKEEIYKIKTVGKTKEVVKTLGGITMLPDITIEEINMDKIVALLLPGADTWAKDLSIHDTVKACMENKVLVAAICGATLVLADLKLLNDHSHTSNTLDYLRIATNNYTGVSHYVEERAIRDDNIITASAAGGLQWAKFILEYLDIYSKEVVENWYNYYVTGEASYYWKLLNALDASI